MVSKQVVVSLGGSLIVPDAIDSLFLKEFRQVILKLIGEGFKFWLVAGGGKTCRLYQEAARKVVDLADEDIDWLGIHATHLNAALLRSIFRAEAHHKILTHYDQKEEIPEAVAVVAGWKPGHSTDYDSVMFASLYGIDTVVNLTNTPFVYTKDPKKFPDAEPIRKISWEDFRKIVGTVWTPGSNLPFDPIASKQAHEAGIKVVVMGGRNLENFQAFLAGKEFEGTEIG